MSTSKPNILFVFADQMHGFALGCMGHPDVKTPNLDRLAARGTHFRQAYSSAPVCTPFRAMLMTGRYGCQTGMLSNAGQIPPGEPMLGEAFNAAGYHTSYVGKWHLGGNGNTAVPRELRCGFTDFLGYQCFNSFTSGILFFDEENRRHEYQGHRTNVTTTLAIERIELARKTAPDRPFAMCVSYQNPHYPLQPAPEFEAMYAQGTLTKRANHRPETEPWTGTWSPLSQDRAKDPEFQKYGGNMDQYLRLYYAMVTQLDHEVGRLFAHLESAGLADNTIVVFTSDHGDLQGSHGLTNKSHFHEESTRIPLIVHDPRAAAEAAGRVIETPVGSIDFFPTLLDWAGLGADAPQRSRCEGKSLADVTSGKCAAEPRPVLIEEIGLDGVVMRSGDHKLVMHRKTREATHFFDLAADPFEMRNLVGEAAFAEPRGGLLAALNRLFDDVCSRANPAAVLAKSASKPGVPTAATDAKPDDGKRAWAVRLLSVLGALLFVMLLIGLLLPALSQVRVTASKLRPAANLRGTLQSMVTFSNSNNGYFPGLNAQGDIVAPGVRFTGSATNTGAAPSSRYWMLLNGQFMGADLLINPQEYPVWGKPSKGIRKWVAGRPVTTGNFSYAMLQIGASRTSLTTRGNTGRAAEWRNTASARALMISDRNTGINNSDAAVRSVWTTSAGNWKGNVVWGDCSAEMPQSNTGFKTRYNGEFDGDDNLFAAAASAGVEEAATTGDSNAMMIYE